MFDRHAQELINKLPQLADLDPVACRRTLSRAYLIVVNNRILTDATADWDHDQGATQELLRRMASALESVAVFDVLNGIGVPADRAQASAFVAAEALALLARLLPGSDVANPDPIQDRRTYALIESALLFMIGGYDINAAAVVAEAKDPTALPDNAFAGMRCRSGRRLWSRIRTLAIGNLHPLIEGESSRPPRNAILLPDIADGTRAILYDTMSLGLDAYFEWLRGSESAALDSSRIRLIQVRDASRPPPNTGPLPSLDGFADTYHLASLLLAAVDSTSRRSIRQVPPPQTGSPSIVNLFGTYLKKRAQGSERLRGRPFLWPSTLEYVHDCLPGPHRDAVISMPTGSGKSFLAELAIAHALARGWVLYLTPTNALAHQVRRDLSVALAPFTDVTITAFLGGTEYTVLSDEQLPSGPFVAVMTPEKCALALRLYPAIFQQCSLCVFDECHLLNDRGRGATADVLLAQLFKAAPDMNFLLMSAMVSNSEELAAWLTSARSTFEHPAIASKIRWRPSRAARGFVFVDNAAVTAANEDGLPQLRAAQKAHTLSFPVPLGWLAGLSGPWTTAGPEDYRTAPLPISANYELKRSRKGEIYWEIESWKNRTGLAVAELLASRGVPAINFILSSRHHAFGQADNATRSIPGAIGDGSLPPLVQAHLAIADAELGVETCLRRLLKRGVAVHTSAMLQVEQAASEWMFAQGYAKLMLATGTLAQGLNLPAVAVVVSGSHLADSRQLDPRQLDEADAAAGLTRANELILNGFGRAGRPGFANQGIVILISDNPMAEAISTEHDGREILSAYPVLGEPDASIAIRSPIERFLDEIMAIEQGQDATRLEVSLTALLSTFDSDDENAGTILRRTFAGYRRREQFTEQRAALARARIDELKSRFLEQGGVPSWMPIAAMRGGVGFFRAQHIWEAYQTRGLVAPDALATLGIGQWFDVLIDVLSHLPANDIDGYLDPKKTSTPRTRLAELAAKVTERDTVPWHRPDGWVEAWRDLERVVWAYMQGRPFTEIGALLFSCEPAVITSKRSDGGRGLPAVFKFLGDIVDRALSQDAGCFLALHECWLAAEHPATHLPEALQALPLCIRNGADSLDVLAWYRFGYRQRGCAHALAALYPLAADLSGDEARGQAVREARAQWLRQRAEAPPVLTDFARTVVQEGGSERN